MNDQIAIKLTSVFNVTSDPKLALIKILKCHYEEISGYISIDEFEEHIYKLTENINDRISNLIQDIVNNKRFIILHGYARNGKTAFFYHFINDAPKLLHEKNIDIVIKRFNFDVKLKLNQLNISFLNAVKEWLLDLFNCEHLISFENFKKYLETVAEFNDFLNNSGHDNPHDDADLRAGNGLFIKFRNEFSILSKRTISRIELNVNDWKDKFINERNAILAGLQDSDSSDILTYIILINILLNKEKLTQNLGENKKKYLVVFDNIDDILSDTASVVTGNYVFDLCNTIFFFQKTYGEKFKKIIPGFDLTDRLSCLYILRSANYVNANARLSLVTSSLATRNRYSDIVNAPVHTLSTVHSSIEIIKKRFELYEELLKFNNIDLPSQFNFFKLYFSSFNSENKGNSDDYIKHRELFRLWNGNRDIVFENFPFDKIQNIEIPDIPKYSYLLKGFYLKLFLLPFKENPNLKGIYNIFINDSSTLVCNLSRLILTYLFNTTPYDKREILKSEDIQKKGTSLYEILFELYKFRDKYNNLAYSEYEIKKTFKKLFHYEIDDWNQLITCTKSTIVEFGNGEGKQGKKINLDSEIEYFFNNQKDSEKTEEVFEKLDKIKFYYNDATRYLIEDVITHFEFISLYETNLPDSLLIDIWTNIQSYPYNHFRSILYATFNKTKDICKKSVSDYFQYMYNAFKPIDYCYVSNFAIKNKFLFDLMISRHITYIEQFRQYILRYGGLISDKFITNKIKINRILVNCVISYIRLFQELYSIFLRKNDIPNSMKATDISFKKMMHNISIIIEKRYEDFTTEITLAK